MCVAAVLLPFSFLFAQEAEISENQSFFDSSGSVRLCVSGEYGSFSHENFDSETVLADSYENKAVRRRYDDMMRLVSKEWWQVTPKAADSSLVKIEKYVYKLDSVIPSEKSVTDFEAKQISELSFNFDGLVLEKKIYAFETQKGRLEESFSWKYDEKKRITEQEKIDYRKSKKNVRKDVYSYSGLGDKPDYVFYENGAIRLKRIYSEAGSYIETAYFDDGFSVETVFEHGIKTQSRLYLNKRLQQRTEYAEE